jgi:hypothetical protein
MLRKVANGLIAWKLKNVREILSIFDEFVIGMSREQFMSIFKVFKVFKVCLSRPYNFLFMNMG